MDTDTQNNPVEPTTADVLAEVERRRTAVQPPLSAERRQTVIAADRFVFWLSKHWLAVCNLFVFLYVALPVLAAVLMALGARTPAMVIHTIYKPLCHQLPQRSWFLFGPQFSYTLPELMERVGPSAMPSPWSGAFVGNETVGYKVALCQRDTAIWGTMFLFGLAYGLLRRRLNIRPLPFWAYVVFGIVPMAIDGGYQWFSYAVNLLFPNLSLDPHETTPLLRTVTGALFGLATVWLAYPYVQEAMDEFHEKLHERFGWE
jgi:uncharacterized membrane protein